MTLLLSDDDVRASVEMRPLIDALDRCFRAESAGEVAVPPRVNARLGDAYVRVMPAILPELGVSGFKAFHGNPRSGARFLVIVSDIESGEILAVVDANYLTAVRTAATSAVAARYLAPAGLWNLGLIGSGMEAETHCLAMAAERGLREVHVFSPREYRRLDFARRMREQLGVPVIVHESGQDAVRSADHVVVATNTGPSKAVAYWADWIEPGQHISAIGSTNPRLRELETEVFRRVDDIVFDAGREQMIEESADLAEFVREGGDLSHSRWLPDVLSSSHGHVRQPADVTMFKSVGTALQDVAAAALVFRTASERGLGTEVIDLCRVKSPAAVTTS